MGWEPSLGGGEYRFCFFPNRCRKIGYMTFMLFLSNFALNYSIMIVVQKKVTSHISKCFVDIVKLLLNSMRECSRHFSLSPILLTFP